MSLGLRLPQVHTGYGEAPDPATVTVGAHDAVAFTRLDRL